MSPNTAAIKLEECHKVRLMKLHDLLIEQAEHEEARDAARMRFDMGTWGEVGLRSREKGQHLSVHNCGTAACALGLAALSGEFSELGLGFRETECGDLSITFRSKGTPIRRAAEEIFGLDGYGKGLFSGDNGGGPRTGPAAARHCAARIVKLVAGEDNW